MTEKINLMLPSKPTDPEGRAHGIWVYYKPDGSLYAIDKYSHGKAIGFWEEYYNGATYLKFYYLSVR
jgi:antitoxin component YwqK of YwqJK toxin-antitoxin module